MVNVIVDIGAKAFIEDAGLVWDDRSDEMKETCRKRVKAIYKALNEAGYYVVAGKSLV